MVRHAGFALMNFLAVASTGVGVITGCTPMQEPGTTTADGSTLPVWDERAREMFDDNIDAAAVGLTLEGPSPRSDRFLRERAQTADLVSRVRVNTVTVDSVGDDSIFHLGIQVGYPALTTPKIPDRTFELHIRPTSRAFGIAKSFDSRLRGLTFIAFIRRFSGDASEPEIHWHLSPDSAEIAAAVKEAVALGELSAP